MLWHMAKNWVGVNSGVLVCNQFNEINAEFYVVCAG